MKPVRVYGKRIEVDGHRLCRSCAQMKPVGQFLRHRTKCTRCEHLGRLYGLTARDFDALLAAQGGACAICGTEKPGGRWGSWHTDHDHDCCPGSRSCGRCVKGLLCNNCNMGIGFFRHSEKALVLAAEYVARTRRPRG